MDTARPRARPEPSGELLALHRTVGNQAFSTALSGGTPLDPATRAEMEAGFGRDLGHVRLHSDSSAARAVAAAGARACTIGRHVFLGTVGLSQGNTAARRLLAHELAHVVQQERGGAQDPSAAGAAHEAHADRAADAVLTGRTAVDVGQGTRVGPARAPEGKAEGGGGGGGGGGLLGRIAGALGGRLLGAVGLPPGSGVAQSAMRGFAEELARQLFKDDMSAAALFLQRVSTMSAGDFGQFVKGYLSGLVEGVVSPVTDLIGLAAFGEHLQKLGVQFLGSVFAGRSTLGADLEQLVGKVKKLVPDWRQAWAKAKADPKATVLAVLGMGEQLRAGADTLAYSLGRSGAQALTESLAEPFKPAQQQEKSEPGLLGRITGPATALVSGGRAVMDRIQNTPWAKVGGKFGYVVGSLAIQLVLLVFTEGLGNLIEQVAQKIGSLGAALGKLLSPVGKAVTRVAEFLGEVGRGVAAAEALIARLLSKALAPVEKILGPVFRPLSQAMEELRAFLRKLFGVVEKDGVQALEKAAATATKTAPHPDIAPTPKPTPHGAPTPAPHGAPAPAPHGAPAPARPTTPYREPAAPPPQEQPFFPVHEKPAPPTPAPGPGRVPEIPAPSEPVVHPPTRRRIEPGPFKEAPAAPPRKSPQFEIDPRFRKPVPPPRKPELPPPSPVPPEPVKTPALPPKPPEPLPKPPQQLPKPPQQLPKPGEPLPPKATSGESVLAPEPPVAVPAGAEVSGPAPARSPALAEVGAETEAAGSVAAPAAESGGRPPVRASAESGGGGGGGARTTGPTEVPEGAGRTGGPGRPPAPRPDVLSDRLAALEELPVPADVRRPLADSLQQIRQVAAKDPAAAGRMMEELEDLLQRRGVRLPGRLDEPAAGATARAAEVRAEFAEAGEHFGPGHTGPGRPRPEVGLMESRAVAAETRVPVEITGDATVMTKADFPDIGPGGGGVFTRPAPAPKPIRGASGEFRGVGKSQLQNIDVQHDADLLERAGAEQIRINQAQVDLESALKLGTNRPDVQATLNGRRIHIEYDRAPGDRALAHARRILANDPDAIVILKIVDF